MNKEQNYLNELTAQQIFDMGSIYRDVTSFPLIPDGYKFVAFRPPKKGEAFLSSIDGTLCKEHVYNWSCERVYSRIIVKPEETLVNLTPKTFTTNAAEVYGKRALLIPAELECIGFRPPLPGEFYMSTSGYVMTCGENTLDRAVPRIVVRKKETV